MHQLTDRDEGAINEGALHVEVPLDLIESAAVTVQRGRDTRSILQRVCESREREGLAGGGGDACRRKPVVGGKRLEQLHDRLEERDGFSAFRATRGQAGGLEGTVAGSVGAPLVLRISRTDVRFSVLSTDLR